MDELPKTSEIRKLLHKKIIYEKYVAELSENKKSMMIKCYYDIKTLWAKAVDCTSLWKCIPACNI